MDEQMVDCVFQDSFDIDFDFELDAPKFFDFTKPETDEEVQGAELWFECSQGYPPSPLLVKLGGVKEEFGDTGTSAPNYGFEDTYSIKNVTNNCESTDACTLDQPKTGLLAPKSKSKGQWLPMLPSSSRLLKPTASFMAKQNRRISIRSTTLFGRLQKLGSPFKSPEEIVSTKRQKLETGYVRKIAHLKHQTIFPHKSAKEVVPTNVNSHARPNVTIPKEPDLKTTHRAQKHRSNKVFPVNDSKSNDFSNALLQEKSDRVYGSNACPSDKKIIPSKGEFGTFRNSKLEKTVPKEFKLSSSGKLTQTAPVELFQKLSLNSDKQPSLLPEQKQPPLKNDSKKNTGGSIMKENKSPNALTKKSTRCFGKQNQFDRGKEITDIANQPSTARSLQIGIKHIRAGGLNESNLSIS